MFLDEFLEGFRRKVNSVCLILEFDVPLLVLDRRRFLSNKFTRVSLDIADLESNPRTLPFSST